MSQSRHAPPGAPLSQERYLSSPQYAEMRGISGNAVTAKAAFMDNAPKRSLLFFLQALSLKPGGLQRFCGEFLEMFADRIGSPTMHREGIKPGKVYKWEDVRKIKRELNQAGHSGYVPLRHDETAEEYQSRCASALEQEENLKYPVESFIEICHADLKGLPGFIIELCINPAIQFMGPGEDADCLARERLLADNLEPDENHRANASRNYPISGLTLRFFENRFRDFIGALFEYQRRYNQAVSAEFIRTEASQKIFEVLDVGLATGKMVVIEGNSRIGKTTAAEAWCNLHLGEARFVSLSGITHKTGVFRALARVLGIGSSYARSATEMQTRIEDLLQRSRLMLVIDEAHHLFSSSERVYSRPELVDWLNTALYNHHVPTGLLCTPQFALRMARAEKQTTWNADQLRGRVKRWCTLPARPSVKDIAALARKRLPQASPEAIQMLTGYAQGSRLPFPALMDAIDEATLLAKREGRETITFEDVEKSIFEYCAESSKAMARVFSAELTSKRPGRKPNAAAQESVLADSEAKKGENQFITAPKLGRRNNLPGVMSGQTSPAGRRSAMPLQPSCKDTAEAR